MKLTGSLCTLSLAAIVVASPLEGLVPRAPPACAADNCLRQLRGNSAAASKYCKSTVLANPSPTVTITVTPTIFSIYGATIMSTHTVQAFTTVPPSPTSSPLAPVASSCGVASTRISSACACLLSTTVPTPVTSTQTIAAITTTVCSPSDNYGIIFAPGTGNFESGRLPPNSQAQNPVLDFPLDFTDGNTPPDNLAQCCRFCYTTQGCVNYGISRDSSMCNLETVTGSSNPTPADKICPGGLLGNVGPVRAVPEDAYYGNGPCSYEVRN